MFDGDEGGGVWGMVEITCFLLMLLICRKEQSKCGEQLPYAGVNWMIWSEDWIGWFELFQRDQFNQFNQKHLVFWSFWPCGVFLLSQQSFILSQYHHTSHRSFPHTWCELCFDDRFVQKATLTRSTFLSPRFTNRKHGYMHYTMNLSSFLSHFLSILIWPSHLHEKTKQKNTIPPTHVYNSYNSAISKLLNNHTSKYYLTRI